MRSMASWLIRGGGCLRAEERLHKTASSVGAAPRSRFIHFLTQRRRTTNLIGILLARPVRMFVEEFAQVDTVSNQVGFFHGDNSQPENSAYLESTPRKQRLQRGYSSGHAVGKSYSLLQV